MWKLPSVRSPNEPKLFFFCLDTIRISAAFSVSCVISHRVRTTGLLLHGGPEWLWATAWGCVFNKLEVTVICCWDQETSCLSSHISQSFLEYLMVEKCIMSHSHILYALLKLYPLLSLLLPLYFSRLDCLILISLPAPHFFTELCKKTVFWREESSIIWV